MQFVEHATETEKHSDDDIRSLTERFIDIRKNLLSLTDVTHTYFEKFVRQLELGFDTIQQIYTSGVAYPLLTLLKGVSR